MSALAILRRDRSGMALVEFALVLPVLLLMFLGGYQLSDLIACNRKVTVAARAVADLVSQDSKTDPTSLDQVLAAATQVMSPYPADRAMTRVSELKTTDAAGNVQVVWSRASGLSASKLVTGSTFKLPAGTTSYVANSYLIFAEVIYTYAPPANFRLVNSKSLTQTVYMLPRKSDDIPCSACS